MKFSNDHLDSMECYSRMRGLVKRVLGRAHVDLRTVAERNGYDPDEAEAFFARHVGRPNGLTESALTKLDSIFVPDAEPPAQPAAAKPKSHEPAAPMKKEPNHPAAPKRDGRSMNTPKRLAQAARVRERHRELLGKWEASGLSLAKFCQQNKLSTSLSGALKKSFPDEYARVQARKANSEPNVGGAFDDAVKALHSLGFKRRDAHQAARAAEATAGPGASAELLVKIAVARPSAVAGGARETVLPPAAAVQALPAVHDQVVNVRLNLLVNVAVQLASQ